MNKQIILSSHVLELHSGHNILPPPGRDNFIHYLREQQTQTSKNNNLVTELTLNRFLSSIITKKGWKLWEGKVGTFNFFQPHDWIIMREGSRG